jgi:hypothetical protein
MALEPITKKISKKKVAGFHSRVHHRFFSVAGAWPERRGFGMSDLQKETCPTWGRVLACRLISTAFGQPEL